MTRHAPGPPPVGSVGRPGGSTIIFDLDNCLAAADEPGIALLAPVFAAVRAASDGTTPAPALEAALRECWVDAFDAVAERHAFTEAMRAAVRRAYLDVEVRGPMRGYGDLHLLPTRGARRFLVTTGFRRLQESKVRALGIAAHFDQVVIDALDDPNHPGKAHIFRDLMARHHLAPDDVVVVGDNPRSELAAAERLGLAAVQILRPGVAPAPHIRWRVRGLRELGELLQAAR
jgi:putative hydrolase of the HAD superfamily